MDREFYNSYIEVDLGILRQNAVNIMKGLKNGKKLIPVIKGNAHGYGTVEVTRMLYEDLGIRFIACAQLCEAKKLRNAGFDDLGILVLGAVPDYCNSPLRMSKMKNCKKADSAAKTRLNQGFLKI